MPLRVLSPELQKISEDELNEVPNRLEKDLKHIRDWLAQQPHLTARTDDQWILSFLRGCKFSLQRTKEKLDRFYTVRTMIPEFFTNRDPLLPEIQNALSLGLCLPLPLPNSDGSRVILIRCPADPSEVPFTIALKITLMIMDILLNEDDNFIVMGQQGLLDNQNATINHIFQVTPTLCKKGVACFQNCYPTRPKGFNFINTPPVSQIAFNIVIPLLPKKLTDRINVFGKNDFERLCKVIPLSILPKEYGGKGDSLNELTVYWKTKVESYRDWFLEDAKYCTNEQLRPGKPITVDEMLGIEGFFRQLDVD